MGKKKRTRDEYMHGRPGAKYGIYNTVKKRFQFDIREDTPMLAEARLFQKIGDDAHKWRFEPRRLPPDGLTAKITLIDEMHAYPNPVFTEALKSGKATVTYRREVRAKWERKLYYPEKNLYSFACSSCLYGCFHSYQSAPIWDYCPNCGAKMDEWEEANDGV